MIWPAAIVLVLVLALIFRLGLLAYAMYTLLGVVLLSRYLTHRWATALSASRECNRLTAEEGDDIAVIITIENSGNLPIPWVMVEDLLPREALLYSPPRLAVMGSRVELTHLWSRSQKNLRYQLKCNRRGYYQLGPLVLETGDLFGLHRRFRVLTQPHFLLVMPKIVPLTGYAISSKRPIGEVRMTYRLYEDPTRISGVRAYQEGDSLNRIHWRATARTGVLHSKVYEPSTVAGVTLLVDFHQASHPARNEPRRSELAITAAASIAHAVSLMGQQVGLVTNGRDAADRIRTEGWASDWRTREAANVAANVRETSDRLRPVVIDTRRGGDQLQQILEMLARLELTDGLLLSELILETSSRLPRDATVIAILPHVTHEIAISLGMLRRRGLAVVAILNMFETYEYAEAAGPLMAEGIETRHMPDEAAVAEICAQYWLR
ncbi:hypothetical protein ETAA8_52970 [Anatilimnocola aggregata]|uniref:DUF58 domain-containing protein n=1 Tax=Anatilimnocola aggregata TaxID=2528021 RepID=A0A517YIX5_9BACT|nr:DUF58 domain-containing protein [Anatilimnocola aggregata]QDU30178.1 hypothetical protein ETAA8_52970 [Anatilimnocola aggregata]